jgi:hypothetical protein
MVVSIRPRHEMEPLPASLQFSRSALTAGAQWQVPAFSRCEFTLACDRDSDLDTVIEINGVEVFRSVCSAEPSGLAGRWKLTTTE